MIGRAVKTYDYINRVVITLPLTVYEGTWMLRLELALVFLEEERVMQQSNVSVSLGF